MKTHPSQRKFGLPVAIVASAHAILFLGFRHPDVPAIVKHKPIDPPADARVIEIFDPEPVEVDPASSPQSKSTPRGDPFPQSDEPPVATPPIGSIPIPVESHAFIPSSGPINIVPVHPGTPGGTSNLSSISELDFVPHVLSRMSPIYPTSMKAQGITGTVMVMFTVDTTGRVSEVSVINSTRHEFEEAALRAVSHWRFEPGKRHNQPTAFRMSIPLNFVLDN